MWEDQTDEGEMGVTYAHIDAYLRGEDIPEDSLKTIQNLHQKTMHKRQEAPGPDQFQEDE